MAPSCGLARRPMAAAVLFVGMFPACFRAEEEAPARNDATLGSLLDDEIKFVFVGGKGGVGKTTTSSALAAQLSKDKKILLVSTDPAHSTGDAWQQKFGGEPTGVKGMPNLDVLELDPKTALSKELTKWDELLEEGGAIGEMVKKAKDSMHSLQGIDEAIALADAHTYVKSGRYDKVIFDTAPTGHTLRLLDLPSGIAESLGALKGLQSKALNAVDGIASAFGATGLTGMSPSFKKKLEIKLQRYHEKVDLVAKMLSDPEKTRFVVVCVAEHLSVSETRRLLAELHERKVKATHVIVNQLVSEQNVLEEGSELLQVTKALKTSTDLPQAVVEKAVNSLEVYSSKFSLQQKYLAELKYSPEREQNKVQLVEVPLLSSEVMGVEALKKFSQLLLQNPAEMKEITRTWNKALEEEPPIVVEEDTTEEPEPELTPEKIKEILIKNKDMQKVIMENPALMKKVVACNPTDKKCYLKLVKDPEIIQAVAKFMSGEKKRKAAEGDAASTSTTAKSKDTKSSAKAGDKKKGKAGKKKKKSGGGGGGFDDLLGGLMESLGGEGGIGDLIEGIGGEEGVKKMIDGIGGVDGINKMMESMGGMDGLGDMMKGFGGNLMGAADKVKKTAAKKKKGKAAQIDDNFAKEADDSTNFGHDEL
ncbi:unnamed protein product [Amoebophrya sp. A120]|nr:unnamed protein product [Amoebophrya sp. A120]|eukprot:GSA120T00001993001.1